jgi:lysozyme
MLTDSRGKRTITTAVAVLSVVLTFSCKTAERFPHLSKMTNGIFLEKVPTIRARREVPQKGLRLTEDSEGFVPNLYDDAAGYCSIAFGHLIKKAGCDGTEPLEFLNGITFDTGQQLLVTDMAMAGTAVIFAIRHNLTDGEFGALSDFVFNVGPGKFQESTLARVVRNNQLDRVPDQFRRWVLAGGRPFPGLVTRREREIVLFFDGLPNFKGPPPAGENLSPIDITVGEQ